MFSSHHSGYSERGYDVRSYSKPVLPGSLSFPLGLQTLEVAFGGIRQWEGLEICFKQQCGISATEFRRLIDSGGPHVIMSARFERWDKRPSIGTEGYEDLLNGVWCLDVYPVARQKKAAARALLIEKGLPMLRRWFEESRPESWYWGRKRCNILFDPMDPSVSAQDVVEAV